MSLFPVKISSMGESISQALVSKLLKKGGDRVKLQEEILELETDKVNQVICSPAAGQLQWMVHEGDSVSIGQIVGQIDSQALPEVQPEATSEPLHPSIPTPENQFVLQRPTQKIAPAIVQSKDCTISDVAPSCDPLLLREKRTKLSGLKRTMATRLLQSQSTTATLTTFNEIDMSEVMKCREHYKEDFFKRHGVKLGLMSFFTKAVVQALEKVPSVAARIEGEQWVQPLTYDIAIAVSTDRGLLVPVLKDCDHLSLAQIEKSLAEIALRAREGKVRLEELMGGCFTISNAGGFGSLLSTPILNPPQSGILGMHKIEKRAVVIENDQIVVRPMMYVALSYDHRVIDGKEAVSFLVDIKESIEQPERMLLDI